MRLSLTQTPWVLECKMTKQMSEKIGAESVKDSQQMDLFNGHNTFPTINKHYKNFAQALDCLEGIEAIDFYLASKLVTLYANHNIVSAVDNVVLFHVFIALSESQRNGHSCLSLATIASQTLWQSAAFDTSAAFLNQQNIIEKPGYRFPDITKLHSLLLPFSFDSNTTNTRDVSSLVVFEYEQLYLRRYWLFEHQLAGMLQCKLSQVVDVEMNQITAIMDRLFPVAQNQKDQNALIDWQKVAVGNALNKCFSIIAGGPGTGKTYTVTKLLAGIVMLAPHLTIEMVAPTGKAAQRLSESIIKAVHDFKQQGLVANEILDNIPTEASTIHRLLGVIKNNPNFRHDQHHQLSTDVLLIDEVSMVDLPMMTRIFRALKPSCRLILLGDADQLPSVAVGSVLADLAPYKNTQFSNTNRTFISNACRQNLPQFMEKCDVDYLTYLTLSRRFQAGGGIGLLAKSVIQGQASQAWQLLSSNDNSELSFVNNKTLTEFVKRLTKVHYEDVFAAETVGQAFAALDKFRILVPSRTGDAGLENINKLVELNLQQKNLIPLKQSLYHGRPIMISQNHYGVNLFNGDIGILFKDKKQRLMAYFQQGDDYRAVSISRLPKFETVFAMTIHKTQGSEFENVALILPEKGADRLLSRELIYTGITRAKKHLQMFTNQSVFVAGVQQKVSRASGLTTRVINILNK